MDLSTFKIQYKQGSSWTKMSILLLTILLPLASYAANITVSVWNDGNGNGQKSNAEGIVAGNSTPLWINLVDPATSQVVGQAAINNSGVATITGAINSASYRLIMTSVKPVLGSTLTESSTPTNFVHTGINLTSGSTGAGDTNNKTGIIAINMPASGNLNNIAFGIEQLPAALSITAAPQQNPNGNYKVPVISPNALDAEDGNIWNTGTGTVVIETLPDQGTLYYNGTAVIAEQIIPNFNRTLLLIDPNDGPVSVAFDYSVIDKANRPSPSTGTITMPFVEPIAFACDSYLYQVIVPDNNSSSILYRYNPFTGNRTVIKNLSSKYNAIGYNLKDNMIWGSDNESSRLVRLDSEGNELFYNVPNLPNLSYNVGDITNDGYLTLYNSTGSKYYVVDLNVESHNFMQLVDPKLNYSLDTAPYGNDVVAGLAISDMAYNPRDNKFYGIISANRSNSFKIITINPIDFSYSLSSVAVSGGGIQGETNGAGAVFFDQNGSFYIFNNSQGSYYRINLDTYKASLLSTRQPNSSHLPATLICIR
ncbi:DUF6923 family protein [Dyadobacter tibetensis]|uniref:DUF6923 family protein n=1 Tax=Dyadobacter tibetensis TaxID=1211851 RepID=UPI00047104EF|nr:hypothetical protein [Dyadobacter tibetensis]